jgi:hypothetical protein
LEEGVEWNIS